jgi:hypothetical protein
VDFFLYEQYAMILSFLFLKTQNFLQVIQIIIILKVGNCRQEMMTQRYRSGHFGHIGWFHSLFTSVLVFSAAAAAATPAATSTTASAVVPAVSVVPAVAAFL